MAETVRYDDLPGWEFVVEERSAGWFELSGQDEYGQSVSNEGSDVDAMLDEARRWAAQHLRDDRPWLAWWQSTGLQEMRKILWRSWDPLNLDRVAPDDEYDQYAAVIASKLKRGQPTSEIATYLLRTLTDPDAPPPRSWVAQCQATAGELVEWYRRSTAP